MNFVIKNVSIESYNIGIRTKYCSSGYYKDLTYGLGFVGTRRGRKQN